MFSPAGIAAEVATFAGMIEAEIPTIGGLVGANPTLIANVTQGVQGLQASAAALGQADSAAAAGPLVDRIVADGNAVLMALSALPLPMSLSIPMRIGQMVLAIVPTVVAVLFPPTSATPAVQPAG